MPLARFQRLAEDKRSELLAIGAREFAEKGFEAASLNEILAAAGLGKSSYYYYFEDKEDLYATCVLDSISRMVKEVPPFEVETLTAKNFWSAIEGYFHSIVSVTARNPTHMALFRGMPSLRRRLAPRFEAIADELTTPIATLIRKGQELGCVRTDLPAETLLHVGMAADNALDDALLGGRTAVSQADLRAHAGVVIDMWKRIAVPAPTARRAKAKRSSR
jgi:AcrR family transcriptional regulator